MTQWTVLAKNIQGRCHETFKSRVVERIGNVNRRAVTATSGAYPMANRIPDGAFFPAEHAEPDEAAIPATSKSTSIDSRRILDDEGCVIWDALGGMAREFGPESGQRCVGRTHRAGASSPGHGSPPSA